MKETIDLLGKIITNILTALYEPFGFLLLLSFLAMFFYLYAYEPIHAGKGWKNAIVTWYQKFKESVFFRKLFFLAFVTSLILFRTHEMFPSLKTVNRKEYNFHFLILITFAGLPPTMA